MLLGLLRPGVAALCRQLEEKALGIRHLQVVLDRVEESDFAVGLATSAPTRDVDHLLRLLALRLGDIGASHGVEGWRVSAPRTGPLMACAGPGWLEERRAGLPVTPEVVDRLRVMPGIRSIHRIGAHESRVPERSVAKRSPLAQVTTWPAGLGPRPFCCRALSAWTPSPSCRTTRRRCSHGSVGAAGSLTRRVPSGCGVSGGGRSAIWMLFATTMPSRPRTGTASGCSATPRWPRRDLVPAWAVVGVPGSGHIAYAELQATSHYSLLRGVSSPAELFVAALKAGHAALGLTDHNTLAGAATRLRGRQRHGPMPTQAIKGRASATPRLSPCRS